MNKLLIYILLFLSESSFCQDSLFVGKTYFLPELRRPLCTRLGEEWAEQEFQAEYGQTFDSIAKFIETNSIAHFEIRTHNDARGSDSMNFVLSQRRANEWLNNLVDRGVNPLQLSAIGVGESAPRVVWVKDAIHFSVKPIENDAVPVVLNEKYINSFKKTDPRTFDTLHQFNRRTELVVISIAGE